jgi:hypothetical protein
MQRLSQELQYAVMNPEILPSMRCLMTAGEALRSVRMLLVITAPMLLLTILVRSIEINFTTLMNGTGV